MNWLAHLHLSEASPAFRLGNILPDLAPAPELAHL
jgi:acyl carrier protein phosphodiesterase